MKRQTPAGQKAIAVAVLILTALSAVYCLSEPPAEAVPGPAASSCDVYSSASSSTPLPAPSEAEELEEHGYYQDPLVNQGPLPNRQAPRRAHSKEKETRQYSRQAADEVVETILGSIITLEMSDIQKCNEVYYYVKGCISYGGTSVKSNWTEAAYWGFTTGRGDEYTFYACSRALLTALGYQVRQVQREGGDLDEPHSWCLVNYGTGWYHFDPCPHLKSDPLFICCLSTDQQLMDFDAGAQRDYYAFDSDAYPERVGGRADPSNTVPMSRQDSETPSPTPAPSSSLSSTPMDTTAPSPLPETQESASPATPSPSASSVPSEPPLVSQAPVSPSPTLPADTASPTPSIIEPVPEATPTSTPFSELTPPPVVPPAPEEPLLPPGA